MNDGDDQLVGDRGWPDRPQHEWIHPGQRIWVAGHNRYARRRLEPLLVGAVRPAAGSIDSAFVVPETCEEWSYFCAKILPRLTRGGEVGLVVADEEGNRRASSQAVPQAYLDTAHALGLRDKGSWGVSSDLRVFRFAPAPRPDPH